MNIELVPGAIKRNKRAILYAGPCIAGNGNTQSNYKTRSGQRTNDGTNLKLKRQSTHRVTIDSNGSHNIRIVILNVSTLSTRIEFLPWIVVCHRLFASKTVHCVSLRKFFLFFFHYFLSFIRLRQRAATDGCTSSLSMVAGSWSIVVFLSFHFHAFLNELNSFCGRLLVIPHTGRLASK